MPRSIAARRIGNARTPPEGTAQDRLISKRKVRDAISVERKFG
jgi:hypothetical protein